MPTTSEIVDRLFDRQPIIDICEKELEVLKETLRENIRNKRDNSGKDLNVFIQPASTTGNTERSLRSYIETNSNGFSAVFVGPSHLSALDKGTSPEELHQEFSNEAEFYAAMNEWGKKKRERYGTEVQLSSMDVWNRGTTLYQEGGGIENIRNAVEGCVEQIDKKTTDKLDKSLYELLDTIVNL